MAKVCYCFCFCFCDIFLVYNITIFSHCSVGVFASCAFAFEVASVLFLLQKIDLKFLANNKNEKLKENNRIKSHGFMTFICYLHEGHMRKGQRRSWGYDIHLLPSWRSKKHGIFLYFLDLMRKHLWHLNP